MWNRISKDLGKELLENGETYIPSPSQCESHMKHMRAVYHKNVDHNRISGNDRMSKCAYFEEMDELFGYRPGVNPSKTTSTLISSSSTLSTSTLSSTSSSTTSSTSNTTPQSPEKKQRKKRKYVSSTETSTKSLLDFLQKAEQKREERESERMRVAKEMHEDKMGILKQLVSLLKE